MSDSINSALLLAGFVVVVTTLGIFVRPTVGCGAQVFTRRGLEKNPTLDVKLALEDKPGSGYGVHRPGLSEDEAGLVAGLLDRVRMLSATEGLIVKVKK